MATTTERQAKKLCKGVKKEIRDQTVTLAKAVLAMQNKIESQIECYEEMPLAQVLTTAQGEEALRANPEIQEFRATVKDYASALNNLRNVLSENETPTNISDIAEIRKKFSIAK